MLSENSYTANKTMLLPVVLFVFVFRIMMYSQYPSEDIQIEIICSLKQLENILTR